MSQQVNLLKDTIFLSSTYKNLKTAREKILLCFQGTDIKVVGMEHFEASAESPLETSLKKLSGCNVSLVIIGDTYGTVDEQSGKSITEHEYDSAVDMYKNGKLKDIWVFKASNEFVPLKETVETDPSKIEKLKKFKEKVCKNRTPVYFNNLDDLRAKISDQCFKSLKNFAEPRLAKAGIGDDSVSRSGISESGEIKFVHEPKPLTALSTDEKKKLELEISEMNKILIGLGRDVLKTIDVKSVTLIGNYYYTTNQYGKAIEMYDLVLREFPDDTRALNNKGSALRGEINREKALECFEKASKLDPNYTDPKVNMGGILSELDMPEKALPILEEVYQKEKPEFTLLLNLGFTYSKLGNYSKAHELYGKAEKLDPNDTHILLNIATLYQIEQNYPKVIEYAEKILRIDPNDVGGLTTKGSALLELKSMPLAIRYLNEALKINPNEIATLSNLSLSYRRLHDFGAQKIWLADWVEMYCDKALRIKENDLMILEHLGWVFMRCGSLHESLKIFNKILEINPKYTPALVDKSEPLFHLGMFEAALACVDEVIKIEKHPKDYELLLLNRVRILKNLNRLDEVKKVLNEINELRRKKQEQS